MLYFELIPLLAGLLAPLGPLASLKELPEPAMHELKALDGKWRVVKFLHSDRETTPGTGDDAVVVEFKRGTVDFAGSAAGAVVELDTSADPKCFDFKVRVGSGAFKTDSSYESVYKREEDTLTWAVYTGQGKQRPSGFDKPTNVAVMVMVLNGIKE